MRRRISEDIFVLYPNRDVRYHIIYCTWNCWHYNLQPDPTQFLMYVSLVHPLARRKKTVPMGNWSYWSNLQPTSLFHQVNIDGNAAPLALKKTREKKSRRSVPRIFFLWVIFGAAGCCLCYISGQPTDMFPWDPKKSVWISWTFSISTLSKVPGRYD